MSVFKATAAPSYGDEALGMDDTRKAAWLKTNYSDPVWLVTDTYDESREAQINFCYRLADGSCLTEQPRLYATVKEYAWFIRDSRFSKIDTAETHYLSVNLQKAVAHALSLKEITSYAHLQKGDIEELVQEFRYGVYGVLHASERVGAHLKELDEHEAAQNQPYRGLPVRRASARRSQNVVDASRLIADCNLPQSALLLERVAWHIAKAAERAGLSPKSARLRADVPPPLQNVTKQQLQRSLGTLDLLYAIKDHALCDVLTFRPFPNGTMKVANQYGVDHKVTPVPPPRLVLHLLEAAAAWVGHYSPILLECIAALEDLNSEDAAQARAVISRCKAQFPSSLAERLAPDEGANRFVINGVQMAATASWLIIAAFGARRYEETIDLNEQNLVGDEMDGWWLDCLISKTTRERELIPVPPIVARAVETLTKLSRTAREQNFEGVFCWLPPPALNIASKPRAIHPRRHLNAFAALVDTPAHEAENGDETWHWVPRQFRRFFAVLYFYRFDGADLSILSYFLRHFDIETTRGYVTRDPEAAKIWREVEKDYVYRLANSIAAGDREVGGAMGDRLKKLARLITQRLDKHLIIAKDDVGERLQTLMVRGGLVITPKPWVTCTCPRTSNAARKARCRTSEEVHSGIFGPSFAAAGPTVCGNCKWALLEPVRGEYAKNAQQRLDASVSSGRGAGTLFGELEKAHLVELQKVSAQVSCNTRIVIGDQNDG